MGLVKRISHDMQQCGWKSSEAALEHHEAHLRHGGVGEGRLHGALREHHDRTEQGSSAANHDQGLQRRRRQDDDVGEPKNQEPASVDDAGVQEGRDRRRRFHDVDEPAMDRQLG